MSARPGCPCPICTRRPAAPVVEQDGDKSRFDFFWYAESNRVHPSTRPAKSMSLDLFLGTSLEDALDFISEWIEKHPEEPDLRSQRAALLGQVGLREAADYDRHASADDP